MVKRDMDQNRGGGRGRGGPEIAPKASYIPRESPRVAIPRLLSDLLSILLHEGQLSGDTRLQLRALQRRLLVAQPGLRGPAASAEVYLADEDQEDIDDAGP